MLQKINGKIIMIFIIAILIIGALFFWHTKRNEINNHVPNPWIQIALQNQFKENQKLVNTETQKTHANIR